MVAQTPVQKTTALRIQRALAKPGAIGMRGMLLWAEAALPRELVTPVLRAAGKYVPGSGAMQRMRSPAAGGFGHVHPMGYFGDDTSLATVSIDIPDVTDSATQAIEVSTDPTVPPVSGATAATPAQPASPSWVSDLANAFKVGAQTWLQGTQLSDAQKIFNVNLQRAQQGLSPIPTNPTQYGLPAPTARIGLTSGTQSAMLWGVGLLAAGIVFAGAMKGRRA